MEVLVYAAGGGAASSRRNVGSAIVAASGTDRTESRVACRETVPLEPAVVERRLLRHAIRCWCVGRADRARGSRKISWIERETTSRAGAAEGRPGGAAANPPHARE